MRAIWVCFIEGTTRAGILYHIYLVLMIYV